MWTDAARERFKDDGWRYSAEWATVEPFFSYYATY